MQKRSRFATHTTPVEELFALRNTFAANQIKLEAAQAQAQKHKNDAKHLRGRVALLESEVQKLRATIMRLTDASEGATEL